MKEELFWFKKPKNMTSEELSKLPTGPHAVREISWTIQEMVAGVTSGRSKMEAIMLETIPTALDDDDLLSWTDNNGNTFGFGRYKNGAYYKYLLPI